MSDNNETEQPASQSEAELELNQLSKEQLIEIINEQQSSMDQQLMNAAGPKPSNYIEFEIKNLATFKMNSPDASNLQLLQNALAFLTSSGVLKNIQKTTDTQTGVFI